MVTIRHHSVVAAAAAVAILPILMMADNSYAFQATHQQKLRDQGLQIVGRHFARSKTSRLSNRQPRGASWTTPSTVSSPSPNFVGKPSALNILKPLHMASSEDDGTRTEKKKSKKKTAKKVKTKKKTKTTTKTPNVDEQDEVVAEVKLPSEEKVDLVTSETVVASTSSTTKKKASTIDDVGIHYGPNPETPDILNFDLTGGRPGSVIESLADLERKREIFEEIERGERKYPKWFDQYGELAEDLFAKYDTDDPDAIDASTLGQYDVTDLSTKFDWEFDPEKGDPDPNLFGQGDELQQDGKLGTGVYLKENPKDEDGIEIGFTSMYGTANPIDTRTEVGLRDSYMIDKRTRNDDMIAPEFPEGDLEIAYNEDVVNFRKSIEIIDTYIDEFLPEDLPVPRHAAKWYGYPEVTKYPRQNYTNNRFTKLEDLTNFDKLTPFRARQRAVELARAKNAEWMPDGVSQAWHKEQRRPYEEKGTLVGTLRKGECDPEIVQAIQPALKILGSCVDLLSIEMGTVFRFHYHGLIKNKYGMSCWTETLIRDCGVDVTGVVFETGFRARDPAYDSGDPYYGF